MTAPPRATGPPRLRLAELVALLSLGTDLGLGQPMEHMIRACLLALRLADRLELGESERAVIYYAGLLAWVGCHTDAYEQAKWLGDDTALKADAHYGYDFGRALPAMAFLLDHVGGPERPLMERARVAMTFLGGGRRALRDLAENHYRATDELAERLGLGVPVRESLRQTYERWDGRGACGLRGDQVALSARLINLADVVEVVGRVAGPEAARAVARERSGGQFDPALVDLFCAQAPSLLADLDVSQSWETVIAAEPALAAEISDDDLDGALEAIGSFAELKSAWVLGHAQAVARIVEEAGVTLGLPVAEVRELRRAALVQDLGRLGIPNTIWDKRGPLTAAEMERVRLHPYLSERMLAFVPALAPLAQVAVQHHERLDGTGYPRGVTGAAISPGGRLLAAADVYQALREPRPQRPAYSGAEAELVLRDEVVARRLDGDAVDAVLRADGHRVRRRRAWPAGLTPREVEVLRLVTRGLSNADIAAQLFISRRTAGSHVENVYGKIGVSNRAQAAIFAMKHGLMTDWTEKSGERPMTHPAASA